MEKVKTYYIIPTIVVEKMESPYGSKSTKVHFVWINLDFWFTI